jgi:aryl-alcohol dehydrogenase-like predicted oxidoreductase
MKLRPLGSTPLRASPLGLGLAALGRPGYINLGRDEDLGEERDVERMRERAHQVLDAAWSGGVRYFDVARSYGRAESFLASWLRERALGAGEVTVGSKWGYTYTAGWQVRAETHEVKEHTTAVLRRQWDESREQLGPYLHLYQIHSATRESGVLENAQVLAELVRLRSEHGVRIGLTLSGPTQAETLLRALELDHGGSRVFDVVQATWNLLEPSAGSALRQAREAGLGVIVKEALANGRLTDHNREPGFAEHDAKLRRQADRLGTTVDALALAAVLAQPWADVVLSGAATTAQLRSNLGALAVAWDAEASESLANLSEAPDAYWRTRSSLQWS